MHVFLPALVYMYLHMLNVRSKVLMFYVLVFAFESVEYFIYSSPASEQKFHEIPADSLIGDIVMATLGLWSAIVFLTKSSTFRTRFMPDSTKIDSFLCCYVKDDNKCNALVLYAIPFIHIILLMAACLILTGIESIESSPTNGFIFYTVTYALLALIFVNIEWFVFSSLCFFFISIGATDVYQKDFNYIPLVNLVVIPSMTFLAYLWYSNMCCNNIMSCWKHRGETLVQRQARFRTKPSLQVENEWRFAPN